MCMEKVYIGYCMVAIYCKSIWHSTVNIAFYPTLVYTTVVWWCLTSPNTCLYYWNCSSVSGAIE